MRKLSKEAVTFIEKVLTELQWGYARSVGGGADF